MAAVPSQRQSLRSAAERLAAREQCFDNLLSTLKRQSSEQVEDEKIEAAPTSELPIPVPIELPGELTLKRYPTGDGFRAWAQESIPKRPRISSDVGKTQQLFHQLETPASWYSILGTEWRSFAEERWRNLMALMGQPIANSLLLGGVYEKPSVSEPCCDPYGLDLWIPRAWKSDEPLSDPVKQYRFVMELYGNYYVRRFTRYGGGLMTLATRFHRPQSAEWKALERDYRRHERCARQVGQMLGCYLAWELLFLRREGGALSVPDESRDLSVACEKLRSIIGELAESGDTPGASAGAAEAWRLEQGWRGLEARWKQATEKGLIDNEKDWADRLPALEEDKTSVRLPDSLLNEWEEEPGGSTCLDSLPGQLRVFLQGVCQGGRADRRDGADGPYLKALCDVEPAWKGIWKALTSDDRAALRRLPPVPVPILLGALAIWLRVKHRKQDPPFRHRVETAASFVVYRLSTSPYLAEQDSILDSIENDNNDISMSILI